MVIDVDVDGPGPGIGIREVVDALAQAIVVTDADGHILLWSRSAETLYGWSEHEVLGRSVLDVLVPVGEMSDNREDLRVVAGGQAMAGDRRVARRDGRVLRVRTHTTPVADDAGTTLFLVGSSEDVGELRDREQQARDISEHFASALEAGGLGTWRWTIASGRTVWDERLEALFGGMRKISGLIKFIPTIVNRHSLSSRRQSRTSRRIASSTRSPGPTAAFTGSPAPEP